MNLELDNLAKSICAYVETDGYGFRRAARVLQSVWRERSNLPMGEHRGRLLGSRLPIDLAEKELANYLTPGIRQVVRNELASAIDHQLFSKPRIYNDLLSSQPLCFNLFGELKADLDLATTVMRYICPGTIERVTDIRFEYSPARSSQRFTGDRSAFDVFVEYKPVNGSRGFLGIEVKYHENLKVAAAPHRSRYDEVAVKMGCFIPDRLASLRQAPLQQFWRDHLLAGSMICDTESGYSEGCFIILFPAANLYCRETVRKYRECLSDSATFEAWTLEEVVSILKLIIAKPWVEEFWKRYLDFSQLYRNENL